MNWLCQKPPATCGWNLAAHGVEPGPPEQAVRARAERFTAGRRSSARAEGEGEAQEVGPRGSRAENIGGHEEPILGKAQTLEQTRLFPAGAHKYCPHAPDPPIAPRCWRASSPARAAPGDARGDPARGPGQAPLLVAGFGLLFAGFGGFFVGLFTPWKLLEDWRLNGADRPQPGRAVAGTKPRVNKVRVMRYTFSSRPAACAAGGCFTTGTRWRAGTGHRPLSPRPARRQRIEGARRSESDPTARQGVPRLGLAGRRSIARRRMDELLVNGAVAGRRSPTSADPVPGQQAPVFAITLRHRTGTAGRPPPSTGHVAFAQERRACSSPCSSS